jgi:SP family myo-inositol transporter-like MFS transporter 13
MGSCLVVAAVAFSYIPINLATLEVESNEIGWPGIVLIITIICFVAAYSSGVATIAWIGTELIPMEVRAVGTMLVSYQHPQTHILLRTVSH